MGLRFGYLLARHLVAGLALLGRSESAKDVEILVLGISSACCYDRSVVPGCRGPTGP